MTRDKETKTRSPALQWRQGDLRGQERGKGWEAGKSFSTTAPAAEQLVPD